MSQVLLHLAVPRLVQIPTVNQVKQGGGGEWGDPMGACTQTAYILYLVN